MTFWLDSISCPQSCGYVEVLPGKPEWISPFWRCPRRLSPSFLEHALYLLVKSNDDVLSGHLCRFAALPFPRPAHVLLAETFALILMALLGIRVCHLCSAMPLWRSRPEAKLSGQRREPCISGPRVCAEAGARVSTIITGGLLQFLAAARRNLGIQSLSVAALCMLMLSSLPLPRAELPPTRMLIQSAHKLIAWVPPCPIKRGHYWDMKTFASCR